jgi:hypothetical protein
MIHCHNLPHEDHDMMHQFAVGDPDVNDPIKSAPCKPDYGDYDNGWKPGNVAPTVTKMTPTDGASLGINVTAAFSEPVTGVSTTNMTLTSASGALIDADVTLNSTGRVATLNPKANLAPATSYTARLGYGIKDKGDRPLEPVEWSFTTGGRPAVGPTVTGRTPLADATDVGLGTNVVARFSKPVAGLDNVTMTLHTGVNPPVEASVTMNLARTVATLNPVVNLARRTTYTVTLNGTDIRDDAGTPLPHTTWTFTTK